MSLDSLYRQAKEATAAGSKSFYFASRFFPPEMARSAHAVYWFCRWTDDLVDEASSHDAAAVALSIWESEVRAALSGSTPEHPVLRVFVEAVERNQIPPEYPLELIRGVGMDIGVVRYESFRDLRPFCYRVASVVGLMMTCVIGWEDGSMRAEGLRQAEDLGIAMQLTNILRDVGEDLRMDRVYLPSDEMEAFGYGLADLRRGIRNREFRDLMRFQVQRARQYYDEAYSGIALLKREGRFAVEVAAEVYRRILDAVEASDFDVFERRAVVPTRVKYAVAARCLALPALGSVARRIGAVWA